MDFGRYSLRFRMKHGRHGWLCVLGPSRKHTEQNWPTWKKQVTPQRVFPFPTAPINILWEAREEPICACRWGGGLLLLLFF